MLPRVIFLWFMLVASTQCALRIDHEYWDNMATQELMESLQVKWNEGTARNVILFVGDGMGPNTVTAARIYQGGESHRLAFEKFPHVGLLKTYSANAMVPDSASTATALFCGVKSNSGTVGVEAVVHQNDCNASLTDSNLKSLAGLALEAGKSAGFVTTMRVTHATPAPLYAHSASRSWECEANMPADATQCKDIARQLVEDWPGKDLHVIMGGGRQGLVSNATSSAADPLSPWSCRRMDGRDLIEQYRRNKQAANLRYSYVTNNRELAALDVDNTDYLLGIFSNGHLSYEFERDHGPEGMPSLTEMVEAAIKVLKKNEKGFFLMVEGGNIDMAHHRGRAKTAVHETIEMEKAVRLAMNMTNEEETLIVVTSDHTHTLSINGYPERGSNIFGIAQASRHDGVNYTTLSYGTGGPGSQQYYVDAEGERLRRREPSLEDTDSFLYEQIASIITDENTHGGGDVAVYAKGPFAHLFHNVHEQHYVYRAVSYAARMGEHSGAQSRCRGDVIVLAFAALLTCVSVCTPLFGYPFLG